MVLIIPEATWDGDVHTLGIKLKLTPDTPLTKDYVDDVITSVTTINRSDTNRRPDLVSQVLQLPDASA